MAENIVFEGFEGQTETLSELEAIAKKGAKKPKPGNKPAPKPGGKPGKKGGK